MNLGARMITVGENLEKTKKGKKETDEETRKINDEVDRNKKEQLKEKLADAKKQMAEKHFTSAIVLLNEALLIEDKCAEAYYLRAEAFIKWNSPHLRNKRHKISRMPKPITKRPFALTQA